MMRLYYNSECSKSRAALDLLTQAGYEPVLVDYINHPPDTATIDRLLARLDVAPDALIRRSDAAAAHWIDPDEPELDRSRVIEILTVDPALMQRPILEIDTAAVIARPPERVFELIDRGEAPEESQQ